MNNEGEQHMTDFGTWLVAARGSAGLTQEELAAESGVHVNTIKNLEAGKTKRPSAQVAASLRNRLGPVTPPGVPTEGEKIKARRVRLGVTRKALAEAVGMSRDTITAVEESKNYRRESLGRMDRTLTQMEADAGLEPLVTPDDATPDAQRVEFRFDGGLLGGSLTVSGPISHLAELEDSIARVLAGLQRD